MINKHLHTHKNILINVHSVNKCLLSTYCVPGTVLCAKIWQGTKYTKSLLYSNVEINFQLTLEEKYLLKNEPKNQHCKVNDITIFTDYS